MSLPFDQILLEQEQKNLLEALVEAERSVPPDKRQRFEVPSSQFWLEILRHPGLPDGKIEAHTQDIEILAQASLIAISRAKNFYWLYVTPRGREYYRKLKQHSGQPVERVENYARNFLNAEPFRRKYPQAYEKWLQAEACLWREDWETQITNIGHDCREAVQKFAEILINRYQLHQEYPDQNKDIGRIKAVIEQRKENLSQKEKKFLESLVDYWKALSGLVQRQEHGIQDVDESLTWEDGRRVVFQTAIVMFEVDRSLSRVEPNCI